MLLARSMLTNEELNLHCVDGTFQNVEILIDGEKSAVANALGTSQAR